MVTLAKEMLLKFNFKKVAKFYCEFHFSVSYLILLYFLFYFCSLQYFYGYKNRRSMDPVHERGSMDTVHGLGPRGFPCFVLSHYHRL